MSSPTSSVIRRACARSLSTFTVVACAAIGTHAAGAQAPAYPAGNTQEFGVDAGAMFALGSKSSVNITLPTARARVGFLLGPASRWSLEPSGFLGYSKVKDVPSVFVYDIEVGLLYHFRPVASVYAGRRRVVPFVRPFIAENGTHSGGTSNNEFSAGAGLGVKVPWRTDVAFRFEGTLGYGFQNKAGRVGLFAGLSFFTR